MRLCATAITSLFSIFLATCSPALADTVYLNDGSILKGELILLRGDKLTLQTEYAGELQILRERLNAIQTEQARLVRLDNDDEVSARLVVDADNAQALASEAAGERQVGLPSIADIRPLGAPAPALSAGTSTPENGPWSGRVELGLQGASGNSQNQSLNAHAAALREKGGDRLQLDALANRASEEGDETDEEYIGTARMEHDFTERAFIFGQAEAERDRFEDVDLRTSLTLGPGYFLIREPDHELKTRLGFGYEYENFRNGDTDNNIIFSLGYDYRLDLWQWFRLTHEFTAIPAVTDEPSENYRLESVLGAELPIGSVGSLWRLRGEYRNDYDHNPEPGVEKLDSAYLLNIVREFK